MKIYLKSIFISGIRGYIKYRSNTQNKRNPTLFQGLGGSYMTWEIHKLQQATTLPQRKARSNGTLSNIGLIPQLAQYNGKIV